MQGIMLPPELEELRSLRYGQITEAKQILEKYRFNKNVRKIVSDADNLLNEYRSTLTEHNDLESILKTDKTYSDLIKLKLSTITTEIERSEIRDKLAEYIHSGIMKIEALERQFPDQYKSYDYLNTTKALLKREYENLINENYNVSMEALKKYLLPVVSDSLQDIKEKIEISTAIDSCSKGLEEYKALETQPDMKEYKNLILECEEILKQIIEGLKSDSVNLENIDRQYKPEFPIFDHVDKILDSKNRPHIDFVISSKSL